MSERCNFGEQVEFNCTIVIFQHGEDYFSATSEKRRNKVDVQVPDTLSPKKIPLDHIPRHPRVILQNALMLSAATSSSKGRVSQRTKTRTRLAKHCLTRFESASTSWPLLMRI